MASRVIWDVTYGLPSRSPPIQLPKRTYARTQRRAGAGALRECGVDER